MVLLLGFSLVYILVWSLVTFWETAVHSAYHIMLSLYQYLFVNLVIDYMFLDFVLIVPVMIIALIPSTSLSFHIQLCNQ